MRIIVTGGAGFIGSTLVRYLIENTHVTLLNVDKLTYAGNLESLITVTDSDRYSFAQIDIVNGFAVDQIFESFKPDAVVHLAAESHVDRSIDDPETFVRTNVAGTFQLLQSALKYWRKLPTKSRETFRFLHVSTDEVYGDMADSSELFSETTPYSPSSPYAASKAASDHLVRAWGRTYELPVLITNCSNNYGPYQFPEKLIPHMILNALQSKSLPVYGDGRQVRDWLYVEDHVRALWQVLVAGTIGETYNIGGHNEMANIDVVNSVCELLTERLPPATPFEDLITFVDDRPGHDVRYAIDASKINSDLGWNPEENFQSGLTKTVDWYLANDKWVARILDGSYRLERIGGELTTV